MDLEDILEEEMEDNREIEYHPDERPVDMGMWMSYQPYNDREQLTLQLENLLKLPIQNSYGRIGFVLSKNIDNLELFLEDISSRVKTESTETVLDTEVYYTSKIEGARTTKKRTFEIHNGAKINNNDFSECMVKGNFEAVKLLNLYGNDISEDILSKVWNVLTTGCRDNEDIQGELYRIDDVGVYGSDFRAVDVDDIKNCMDSLIDFYNSNILDNRPFIKAAIIHYNFETIHPFCDGNGRMGRLLMNNYLISRGIESCRAVSFSEQIDKSRGLYDGAFIKSENEFSDCTPFLEYMLDVMAQSYEKAIKI